MKFLNFPLSLGTGGELYSIFHLPGNLASTLKNGIVNLRLVYHVSKIRIEIEAIQISPDDGFECSMESYDTCLTRERQLLNTSCTLPFENITSSQHEICSTYEQGMDTVREILTARENCKKMCLQVNIKYFQEPERYLLALIRPKVIDGFSNQDFGYYFLIPKDVRLLTNKHDYTATVALGYFGSIVGIFTGVSILSFFILFTDTEYMDASIRKRLLLMVQGVLNIYLAGVFILLFCKFLQNPSNNTINFIYTKTDFSLSVCSKPYVHENFGLKTLDSLSNVTFWKKWRNMNTMIDSILINNGSQEVNLNLDADAIDVQFFIIPIDNNSIAVCNVIDLSPYGMLEILQLYYTTEIEIYLHRNGQFFYEWQRKENMIVVSSYRNVRNLRSYVELFDFTAYISNEVKSTLVHESESFDDCVKSELKEKFETEMTSCLFSRSAGNNCQTVFNSSSLNSIKTTLHETKCKTPKTVLNTQAEFSNAFSSQTIKKDTISEDTNILIQQNSGEKPKVTLRFTGMTKIKQVLYFKQK